MQPAQILIVDDNPVNLKLARVLLEGEGYAVQTAVDAESALELVSRNNPRLILMDVQLPGMDGLQLTRLLKDDEATKGIVIIALTAYAMKSDEQRAKLAGCDGYVTKPIDLETLCTLVAHHLRNEAGP